MNLSIIIPTCGRESLLDLLTVLHHQLGEQDEIIVVQDGGRSMEEKVHEFGNQRFRYTSTKKSEGLGIGSIQRNIGIDIANGSHLSFLDDDDAVELNYIQRIREGVLDDGSLHLFRIRHEKVGVIWKVPEIKWCNVSTQMLVVPNWPTFLPRWSTTIYESDYYFIKQASELFKAVVWHKEIIATHNGGAK